MYFHFFSKHLSKIKKGTKGNYSALCPFHNDKVQSFSFNEETGLWQCFACGEKGNIKQFLEKVGDIQALKELRENNTTSKVEKEEEEEETKIEYSPLQIEKLRNALITLKDHPERFQEIVKYLRDAGFYIFPSIGKSPSGKWSSIKEKNLLNTKPVATSGLLLLSDHLAVIDIDSIDAFCEEFKITREEIEQIATVRTGKGYHIYVYDPENSLTDKSLGDDGFEIRKGNKKLIMLAGSKIFHPSLKRDIEYQVINPEIYTPAQLQARGFTLFDTKEFYFQEALNFNPDIIIFTRGKLNALTLIENIPEHREDIAVLGYKNTIHISQDTGEFLKDKIVYMFNMSDIDAKKSDELIEKIKPFSPAKIYTVDIELSFFEANSTVDAFLIAKLIYEANYEYIHIPKLFAEGVKEREFLDEEWKIPKGVVGLIAGLGGVGKGYLTVYLALEWVQKGYNVAFLLGEDDREEVKRRIISVLRKIHYTGQKGKLLLYELLPDETISVVERFVSDFDIVIVDPLSFFIDDEINATSVAKTMRRLQYFCKTKGRNIFLVHHLKKFAQANTKEEMLDAIRGSGAFHNNARYVSFVKRAKDTDCGIDVYNAKNSYAKRDADFRIHNLFPGCDEKIRVERISDSSKEGKEKTKEKKKEKESLDF